MAQIKHSAPAYRSGPATFVQSIIASPRGRQSDQPRKQQFRRWNPNRCTNVRLGSTLVLVLAAATVAVYWPVSRYPFNALNDGEYIRDNLRIQQLDWSLVKWSFTTFYAANWHPVTWISHALDCQLFSLNPGGHHDSNLMLHVLNVVLLFWILWRATSSMWRSFMVAALFALHPINVESVAWIAERKNLLSMFFLLVALGVYRGYALKPEVGRYIIVAGVVALALMSKAQAVTLPFIFLLWDYWPLRRMLATDNPLSLETTQEEDMAGRSFSWLVMEKLPLFALSVVVSVLTVKAQRAGGAMGGALASYSISARLGNAVISYTRYLGKAVWPAHLAFFYPHPRVLYQPQVWESFLVLLLITGFVIVNRDRRYLAVGWLWFLGTLVPMIGLVQVGGQAMADRYAYLPFVGLFIAACWGVSDRARGWHHSEAWLSGASVAVLLLLVSATHRQLSYWSDDVALWSHTVQVTGANAAAQSMLGEALQREGRSDAFVHFRAAAETDPLLVAPHYHLGIYEQQRGDMQVAIAQFEKVIETTQSDTGLLAGLRADTFLRMSYAYHTLGELADAEKFRELAVKEKRKQRDFKAISSP